MNALTAAENGPPSGPKGLPTAFMRRTAAAKNWKTTFAFDKDGSGARVIECRNLHQIKRKQHWQTAAKVLDMRHIAT
jgi:hypothetical protein